MRKSTGVVLVVVCLLAGLEAARAAQDEPSRPQNRGRMDPARLLGQLDRNDDGFLDRSEIPQRMQQRFEQMDLDGDGKLSREELRQWAARAGNRPAERGQAAPGNALLRLLDADGDGELSHEEIEAAPQVLQRIDTNGDGKVDRQELLAIARAGRGGRPGEIITPAAKGERHKDKLQVGHAAPDFTLPLVSGGGHVTLSRFRGYRPVVLIFASYT